MAACKQSLVRKGSLVPVHPTGHVSRFLFGEGTHVLAPMFPNHFVHGEGGLRTEAVPRTTGLAVPASVSARDKLGMGRTRRGLHLHPLFLHPAIHAAFAAAAAFGGGRSLLFGIPASARAVRLGEPRRPIRTGPTAKLYASPPP